jgi:hypothetical protein|tara:strand:- start:155 stop:685 length:531 start_codon:yes stop_codon:yes gene_type:complete
MAGIENCNCKKTSVSGRFIIGIIVAYVILLGCYYGYKKYKEYRLCNESTVIAWIFHMMEKHNSMPDRRMATYVDKMVRKNMTHEEAIEKFYINNESIFKRGAPYDIETPITPKDCSVPSPGKTVIECEAEARNMEVMGRCKVNIGGFRMSTLYFGDGFYNYHIPKLVDYTVPGISV